MTDIHTDALKQINAKYRAQLEVLHDQYIADRDAIENEWSVERLAYKINAEII